MSHCQSSRKCSNKTLWLSTSSTATTKTNRATTSCYWWESWQTRKMASRLLQTSTFNTCDHQPLPMMEGTPLRLVINPNADPVAFHTPVPVPLHWQDDAKAGLNQDVCLWVIKPVPIKDSVTWCHRMVIYPKKNGKLRRTADFQPLININTIYFWQSW